MAIVRRDVNDKKKEARIQVILTTKEKRKVDQLAKLAKKEKEKEKKAKGKGKKKVDGDGVVLTSSTVN